MKFPKDSFPHKSVVEWWYFNGNLHDKKGKKYAFMNCLFKADPKKTQIPLVQNIPAKEIYFSHSIFSDIKENKFIARTHPLSILSNDSLTKKKLFINYLNPSTSGYVNNELIELGKFKYKIKNDDVELTLKARKKPLLHNGKGEFIIGRNKLHYYSLTDMDAKGIVRVNGKAIKVKGKAWMDHEWAGFSGAKNWNWFSIQLDNGVEIMIQDYNNGENVYVGINPKNQKAEFTEELLLLPRRKWRSHFTGAKYPVEWQIAIPSKKIELDIKALIENQELLFGALNYWEGPIKVSGKMNGKVVNGRGFMEMIGRKMKASRMQIYKHELRKEAAFYIKLAKKELKIIWDNHKRR
jgi:predicted secreted hydrolase